MVVWGEEPLGEYTVRSGYRVLLQGIIVRDSRCRVIGSKEIVNEHVSSTFATEALACLRTLRLGMNLGIREVVVEDDSLSVDIKSEERMYRDSQFAYVPRESNGTNHILAREGLKRAESINLGVYVPRFLVEVLDLDCQGDVITPHGSLSLSFDPNELPKGPMIRVRSKHFQEAVSALFLRCWKEDQLINDGVARANLLKIPCTLV
ncbi:hypothetical protein Golax_010373 [Gossypium laxum]|uniref:RNase H type-1 domain-containing protein n=1 Tax=Gossypium laxum TaxID=34288 RepID=A0A7J8ZH17_9ROSI|nr:hypothetical protein [Gossypium laxum]